MEDNLFKMKGYLRSLFCLKKSYIFDYKLFVILFGSLVLHLHIEM
jgi:hypothetical protein